VCFIDRDLDKVDNAVVGLPVYSEKKASECIEKLGVTDVIIAISNADSDKMNRLYHTYREMGCQVRVLDTLVQSGEEGGSLGKEECIPKPGQRQHLCEKSRHV
jgi:FlaA1/EpsC-like NDP-sugar epimerase